MVRVVSQSFNHPRSRHSSGESDLDLALRADLALSTLRARRNDFADYESSSDSFWDSEFDTDQQDPQNCQKGHTEDELNGNDTAEKSDMQTRRKERRRERNKVSAQAYRQRRRMVNNTTQQELTVLEERNKHLLQKVHELEVKTEQAKQLLKNRHVSVQHFMCPNQINNGQHSTAGPFNSNHELHTPIDANPSQCLSSPHPSLSLNMNMNSNKLQLGNELSQSHHLPNGNDSLLNSNLPKISSINLNAIGGQNEKMSTGLLMPLMSPSSGLSGVVKPKQNMFNANHYYKLPIRHSKNLRTVHEVPSNISNAEDDMASLSQYDNKHSVHNFSELKCKREMQNCDTFGTDNGNAENLNMNERVNSNLASKDEKIWNGTFNLNSLKTENMNDNETSTLSEAHLKNNSPLLVGQNGVFRLIIRTGENSMPSQ